MRNCPASNRHTRPRRGLPGLLCIPPLPCYTFPPYPPANPSSALPSGLIPVPSASIAADAETTIQAGSEALAAMKGLEEALYMMAAGDDGGDC